jgi:hypothetical protein
VSLLDGFGPVSMCSNTWGGGVCDCGLGNRDGARIEYVGASGYSLVYAHNSEKTHLQPSLSCRPLADIRFKKDFQPNSIS